MLLDEGSMNDSSNAVLLSSLLEPQLNVDANGLVTLSVVIGLKTPVGLTGDNKSLQSVAVQTACRLQPVAVGYSPRSQDFGYSPRSQEELNLTLQKQDSQSQQPEAKLSLDLEAVESGARNRENELADQLREATSRLEQLRAELEDSQNKLTTQERTFQEKLECAEQQVQTLEAQRLEVTNRLEQMHVELEDSQRKLAAQEQAFQEKIDYTEQQVQRLETDLASASASRHNEASSRNALQAEHTTALSSLMQERKTSCELQDSGRAPPPRVARADGGGHLLDFRPLRSVGQQKHGYQHLEHDEEMDDIMDPEAAKRLLHEIGNLEARKTTVQEHLAYLDSSWTHRRKPHESELFSITRHIAEKREQLEEAQTPRVHTQPYDGPAHLRFVTKDWFGNLCNIVILLNAVSIALQLHLKNQSNEFILLDNLFLLWYVFELVTKVTYYQSSFFIGDVSVVWWSWLDACIVGAGIVDQWLVPLFARSDNRHVGVYMSVFRSLRLLRLFRILRLLKLVKVFFRSDLSWTNGTRFELFMGGVIVVNSIIMALELDVPWEGWNFVENVLLVIYSFELALRLKRDGWRFFVHYDDCLWHYIDFLTVVGGALDLWLAPLLDIVLGVINGQSHHHHHGSTASVVRLLKIMRILRVLRLVRLVKTIKPLYTLILGVMESVGSMQWVILLAFLTLYACAIVFTNIVGRGLLTSGAASKDAIDTFGSVTKSLFALFRLMNGDMTVIDPITGSLMGQLMFVAFIVVSNWAILATLTAVVADHMILTSRNHIEDLHEQRHKDDRETRSRRLRILFEEIDEDGDGRVSNKEWQHMMKNTDTLYELCDATGFNATELRDYFECLAEYTNRPSMKNIFDFGERYLDYNLFVDMLKDESRVADKRCIWHVMSEIRALQIRTETKYRRNLVSV